MIRRFVKAFSSVTVKDWSAESRAFNAVAITATSDMAPGKHEFELSAAGRAKQGN